MADKELLVKGSSAEQESTSVTESPNISTALLPLSGYVASEADAQQQFSEIAAGCSGPRSILRTMSP